MSVFTSVSEAELSEFLDHYDVGELVRHRGIEAGIENSNFFVTTSRDEFVLTLFERVPSEDLPYFMNLTSFLADHGVACMHPIAGKDGSFTRRVNGKDAALVVRLIGGELDQIDTHHCNAVGRELARLHVAGRDFPQARHNGFALQWLQDTIEMVEPHSDQATVALMRSQLEDFYQQPDNLPEGVIHADIFTDNVLFNGDELSGIIDFYYACNDALAYDLAITLNDWCTDEAGHIKPTFRDAFMHGYESIRPLEMVEHKAMPLLLRKAAFRFFLSRLKDKIFPREGEMVKIKDPEVFRRILQHHLQSEQTLRRA